MQQSSNIFPRFIGISTGNKQRQVTGTKKIPSTQKHHKLKQTQQKFTYTEKETKKYRIRYNSTLKREEFVTRFAN